MIAEAKLNTAHPPKVLSLPLVVAGLFAFCLLGLGYGSTILRLVGMWWDHDDYSHGFIVPLISAGYLYVKRDRVLAGYRSSHSWWALLPGGVLIAAAGGVACIGVLGRALPVEGFSLVLLSLGVVWMLCGPRVALTALPACLLLVLMLPIPGGIIGALRGQLQSVATTISVFSLQTLGFPVLSRGNVIMLPEAEIGVAEACSGLRMLVSFTALVSALAMFVPRPPLEKALLMLSIIPIAVMANVWRVVVVTAATYWWPTSTEVVHDWAGLGMMFVAMAMLWALLWFMTRLFINPDEPAGSPQSGSALASA